MEKSSSREYTLSFTAANLYALLVMVPIVLIYILPYAWIYGWAALGRGLVAFIDNILVFAIALVVGTVAHELIHAVSWSWLDGISWDKIHFGFKWKMLTPYVHCPEPVEVGNYRWGVVMPGLVLGVLPYIISLILQSGWLLGFGLFFTLAAGGDLLILWLLRGVKAGTKVQDHPDLVGCKVIE